MVGGDRLWSVLIHIKHLCPGNNESLPYRVKQCAIIASTNKRETLLAPLLLGAFMLLVIHGLQVFDKRAHSFVKRNLENDIYIARGSEFFQRDYYVLL